MPSFDQRHDPKGKAPDRSTPAYRPLSPSIYSGNDGYVPRYRDPHTSGEASGSRCQKTPPGRAPHHIFDWLNRLPQRKPGPNLVSVLHKSAGNSGEKVFRHLHYRDLLSIRATCRALAALAAPCLSAAFSKMQYTLTARALTNKSLECLSRIGGFANTLTITLPHTEDCKISLPLRDENDPHRVFTVHPCPVDTFWTEEGVYSVEKNARIVVVPNEALFLTARDARGWATMIASMKALKKLRIFTPGRPPGRGLERSIVDEALLTLRDVLEDRGKVRGIREFSYDGHAAGIWILHPMLSWSGKGTRKAWWAWLVKVEIVVSRWSLESFHSWERGTVERAWRGFLAAVSENVQYLAVEMRGDGPQLECPLVDETIVFPKLTQLKTRGFQVRWGGDGGFAGLLQNRAPMVVEWTVEEITLIEGNRAWTELFVDWELMNPERMRTQTDCMNLRRKDGWFGIS
jgi:hypothetical protein